MTGVLSELAPQEQVVESESGGEDESVEAPSFAFWENKERKLPADVPVEHPLLK